MWVRDGPSDAHMPLTLLVLMMWPSSEATSSGMKTRLQMYTPFQHTLKVFSHASRSSVMKLEVLPMPALLNSRLMWSVSWAASASSRNRAT